ncbi:MAG TPA: DUF983 domain-containing protein [Rhizomicrobium sp.]|jgi:uncharacterized protein (DUF983 family)|nr:DUF983 domain-containing protein [Rhizomicrobium sp.]
MASAEPRTLAAALLGLCPRCGEGPLFNGYLSVAPRCSACGLDYAMFDAGDGPAVFVILIVGAIVAGGALIVEFTYQPPYWVHAVIWIPAILILTTVFLRLAKSTLLVLQYKHRAGEGRLAD